MVEKLRKYRQRKTQVNGISSNITDVSLINHQHIAGKTITLIKAKKLAQSAGTMRRNTYPYQPLNQTPVAPQDVLEEQNEVAAEELKQKIGALKSLTIDIGNEVRYQDKLLRGIDDDMDRTGGFLGNTMARVVRLGKHSGSRHMCYMFLFVLFVFLLLYLVIKIK